MIPPALSSVASRAIARARTFFRPLFDSSRKGAEARTTPASVLELSRSPSIWIERAFLTDDECAHLILLAKDKITPSLTVDLQGGGLKEDSNRTSQSAWL